MGCGSGTGISGAGLREIDGGQDGMDPATKNCSKNETETETR